MNLRTNVVYEKKYQFHTLTNFKLSNFYCIRHCVYVHVMMASSKSLSLSG